MPTVVSYTTVELIESTLVNIGSITTLRSADVAHHASRAETVINAAIAKRYSLPFSSPIPVLETLATDMAVFNILTGRITINEEHPWFVRYKNAEDLLDKIANGDISLVTSSGEVQTGRSDLAEVWSNTKDYHPTMWEGPWEDQTPDADKLKDQADDRDITLRNRLL